MTRTNALDSIIEQYNIVACALPCSGDIINAQCSTYLLTRV